MAEAFHDSQSPEAARFRAEVQAERHRQILGALTTRTTMEAIESANLHLRNPNRIQCHPAEREALVAGWQAFCTAAAEGGEVWAFRSVGACSSFEGFAVIRGGRVVADEVTSVSTWI